MNHDELQTAIYQERERYAEEDVEHPTPREINNGLCRMFARRVAERLSIPIEIETIGFNCSEIPAHAWIAFDGRYYDAEVPEGVDSRTELPFFERNDVATLQSENINTLNSS